MKFQKFVFSGILVFAASIVWNTMTASGYLKITSPAKGQKVPVGNIVIFGTSSSNSTNHCTVSINIIGIKPNQNVLPTGPNGPNDDSKWTFTDTSKYSLIKQGFNKITSKYSCPQNINFIRFYRVNVTGVKAAAVASLGQHQTPRNTAITSSPFPPLQPGH